MGQIQSAGASNLILLNEKSYFIALLMTTYTNCVDVKFIHSFIPLMPYIDGPKIK